MSPTYLANKSQSQQRRVLIRVDAYSTIGSGHVMRCVALAQALRSRNYVVAFVSAECHRSIRDEILARGFSFFEIQKPIIHSCKDEEKDALSVVNLINQHCWEIDWLVVDCPNLGMTWEQVIRQNVNSHILSLDDTEVGEHVADAVLVPHPFSGKSSKSRPSNTFRPKFLRGGEFALLREEFAQVSLKRGRSPLFADGHITIFLGSVDSDSLTHLILNHLQLEGRNIPIRAILGHLNEDSDEILRWCHAHEIDASLAGVGFDFAHTLDNCRVFVGSCGATAIEAQGVGIPTLLIPLSEIQRNVAGRFVELGRAAIISPRDCADKQIFDEAFYKVLQMPNPLPPDGPIALDGAARVSAFMAEVWS